MYLYTRVCKSVCVCVGKCSLKRESKWLLKLMDVKQRQNGQKLCEREPHVPLLPGGLRRLQVESLHFKTVLHRCEDVMSGGKEDGSLHA